MRSQSGLRKLSQYLRHGLARKVRKSPIGFIRTFRATKTVLQNFLVGDSFPKRVEMRQPPAMPEFSTKSADESKFVMASKRTYDGIMRVSNFLYIKKFEKLITYNTICVSNCAWLIAP